MTSVHDAQLTACASTSETELESSHENESDHSSSVDEALARRPQPPPSAEQPPKKKQRTAAKRPSSTAAPRLSKPSSTPPRQQSPVAKSRTSVPFLPHDMSPLATLMTASCAAAEASEAAAAAASRAQHSAPRLPHPPSRKTHTPSPPPRQASQPTPTAHSSQKNAPARQATDAPSPPESDHSLNITSTSPTSVSPSSSHEMFSAEMLLDLAGSTSAEVRRMNDDERALVHFKRRLRNRESAKRSRARRQATINDIQSELSDLRELTASLVDRCVSLARLSDRQEADIETLRKEKSLLESLLRSNNGGHLAL